MAGNTNKNSKKSKKSAPRKAASTAAAPRRRKSGIKGVAKIPKLTTAAAITAANMNEISWVVKQSFSNPRGTLNYMTAAGKAIIRPENLAKTAKAALVGYGVGYVAKKDAPKVIKKPMAKIANKVM